MEPVGLQVADDLAAVKFGVFGGLCLLGGTGVQLGKAGLHPLDLAPQAGKLIVGHGLLRPGIGALDGGVILGGASLSGGVGTVTGTLLGSMIIGVINNGLNLLNVNSYYQDIVKGIIIILAVMIKRNKATK